MFCDADHASAAKSCSALDCDNVDAAGCNFTFHRFPVQNEKLKKHWEDAVREHYGTQWTANENSFVCSDHFLPEDFASFEGTGSRRLKEDAVPSVFRFSTTRPSPAKVLVPIAPKPAKLCADLPERRRDQSHQHTLTQVKTVNGKSEMDVPCHSVGEKMTYSRPKQNNAVTYKQSVYCTASNCSNSHPGNTDRAFFRFPRNKLRCRQWIVNIRRTDLLHYMPCTDTLQRLNHNKRLCDAHFEDDQFMFPRDMVHPGTARSKLQLKWNAVPTIFDVQDPYWYKTLHQKYFVKELENSVSVNTSSPAEEPAQTSKSSSQSGYACVRGTVRLVVLCDRVDAKHASTSASTDKNHQKVDKSLESSHIGEVDISHENEMSAEVSEDFGEAQSPAVTANRTAIQSIQDYLIACKEEKGEKKKVRTTSVMKQEPLRNSQSQRPISANVPSLGAALAAADEARTKAQIEEKEFSLKLTSLQKRSTEKTVEVRKLERKLKRLEAAEKNINYMNDAEDVVRQLQKYMKPGGPYSFVASQIRLGEYKNRGHRFNEGELRFAESILKRSEKTYRWMLKTFRLPSESTVRRFMRSKEADNKNDGDGELYGSVP